MKKAFAVASLFALICIFGRFIGHVDHTATGPALNDPIQVADGSPIPPPLPPKDGGPHLFA